MELEKLKEVIAEILNVDTNEITEESTFLGDLGADSLDIYQILIEIEEDLEIEIKQEDIENITTVGEAAELIEKALQAK